MKSINNSESSFENQGHYRLIYGALSISKGFAERHWSRKRLRLTYFTENEKQSIADQNDDQIGEDKGLIADEGDDED